MFVVLMSELRRLKSDDRGIFTRLIETVFKGLRTWRSFSLHTAFLNTVYSVNCETWIDGKIRVII